MSSCQRTRKLTSWRISEIPPTCRTCKAKSRFERASETTRWILLSVSSLNGYNALRTWRRIADRAPGLGDSVSCTFLNSSLSFSKASLIRLIFSSTLSFILILNLAGGWIVFDRIVKVLCRLSSDAHTSEISLSWSLQDS